MMQSTELLARMADTSAGSSHAGAVQCPEWRIVDCQIAGLSANSQQSFSTINFFTGVSGNPLNPVVDNWAVNFQI